MFLRHAIVVTLSLTTLTVLSAGCDDEEKATPQVIFDGALQQGAGADCRDSGELFVVGDFGNQQLEPEKRVPTTPIKDGATFGQGSVSIACSVTAAGADEFNVSASINLGGATGGFFKLDGKFKATGDQTGINALFSSRKSGNSYEQKDRACIVRYTTPYQGVAAGRVWGEITCEKAENANAGTTCKAIAQFRFENCAQ